MESAMTNFRSLVETRAMEMDRDKEKRVIRAGGFIQSVDMKLERPRKSTCINANVIYSFTHL